MFFRSFFDENLAHMSYLVGCQPTGEAIVIDPARRIDDYLETAKIIFHCGSSICESFSYPY
ncbi:UNVERIFIED_CONTAM: hypothetical protein FO527_03195 [Bacillus sp. ATCC 13368]